MHRAERNREEEAILFSAIDVLWDPKLKATVVVTKKRLKAKQLMLPPCIPDPKLRAESVHPYRVAIQAKCGAAPATTFYMHPEWAHPREKVVATASAVAEALPAVASAVAEAPPADAGLEHRMWKWNGKEVMHPMWAVRRLSADELRLKSRATSFNMEQQEKRVSAMVVNGTVTTLWAVTVPMLTNAHDIEAGVELLWEANVTMKKQTEQTKHNWIQDQQKKEKDKNAPKEKKRKSAEMTSGVEI